MNYSRIYSSIVNTAKSKRRVKIAGDGLEFHHIKPRSLYPELATDPDNLVLLTGREHYICHWLLTKIYPCQSMFFAFMVMCNKSSNENFSRSYKVNSRTYEKLKIIFQQTNPAKSDEARKKISEKKAGENHHYWGVASHLLPNYKAEIIVFEHKDGRVFKGTRREAIHTLGLRPAAVTNLIKGWCRTAHGWYLQSTPPKARPKGADAPGADLTVYTWYNLKTTETLLLNRHAFSAKTGISKKAIQSILYKERNSVFGWTVNTPTKE